MAQKDDAAAPENKGSGMLKIILMVVGGLILIGGSVGGTLFMTGALNKNNDETQTVAEAAPNQPIKPIRGPAIYQPLEPPFIVNFEDQGVLRYLQVGLTTMTRDPRVTDIIMQNMPQIRNDLILLFSNQKFDVLTTLNGKEKLRQQALLQIQSILSREFGLPGIEAVYFTTFVLQ